MRYIHYLVLLLLIVIHAAKSHLDLALAEESVRNRSRRDVSCREGLEYPHDNICCLNCPAGTYVKKACDGHLEKGVCEPCTFDAYTEDVNGLKKCLSCTKCRSDQETVEKCTSTQNTQCRCKQGSFCLPDQACEVCKKCSKCREDEVMVKSCTVSSNSVCTKRSSVGNSILVIFIVVPLIVILACIASFLYWRMTKPSKRAVTSRSPRQMVKICIQGDSDEVGEERQNAQNSKLDDSSHLQPFLEENYPERESSRRLLPLNGEDSLRKTFDLFEEVDVHYHNRFFRLIGLSDNAIKSTESQFPEDRVYELLKIWMEKEGLKADFNNLIDALIYLDQRLSAENIVSKAISNGYFKYEDE